MKILSKKNMRSLEDKIRNQENHINSLSDKLSKEYAKNIDINNKLHSKTKYAEEYVQLYKEAKKKNNILEDQLDMCKSRIETQSMVNDKMKTDIYLLKTEADKSKKSLEEYEDVAKKALNEFKHRYKSKRIKKKKEKDLYYKILSIEKK
ncbi:MAG: hypothetical protein ACRCX2_33690 [Paraclostridium sp.]